MAKRLRERAARNHRSLQGELMAILQEVMGGVVARERAPASAYAADSGWRIAPASESTLMIREDREGRTFTIRDLHKYVSDLGPGTPGESTAWIRQGRRSR